jgi:hypothetical protein
MTSSAPKPPGKIVTFYSYKGGTGRTMALANVGWILAASGKRVLLIDWDLEAPGLHRYLHPFLDDPELASSKGIIDWALDAESLALAPEPSAAEGRVVELQFEPKPVRGIDWFVGSEFPGRSDYQPMAGESAVVFDSFHRRIAILNEKRVMWSNHKRTQHIELDGFPTALAWLTGDLLGVGTKDGEFYTIQTTDAAPKALIFDKNSDTRVSAIFCIVRVRRGNGVRQLRRRTNITNEIFDRNVLPAILRTTRPS